MSQVRLLHIPTFILQAHHIALHFFWKIFLLIKLYPWNFLSRECGLYKASDLLLGDHVCEKSDAVNWIDCP